MLILGRLKQDRSYVVSGRLAYQAARDVFVSAGLGQDEGDFRKRIAEYDAALAGLPDK